MTTLEALKVLAAKICKVKKGDTIDNLTTIAEVVEYIAENINVQTKNAK